MKTKPVIFLAFANEDGGQHLRGLKKERIAIRNALNDAKFRDVFEEVVEVDATTDDIFRVFRQYKDRIVIFHYAGHANSQGLSLRTETGNELANAGGLAQLFALQQNLQLVFLNGCSTQKQVAAIQAAGISNVIATSKAIDDTVARHFATQFYENLANDPPHNIETAFNTAIAYVETRIKQQSNYRNFYWEAVIPALKDTIDTNVAPWVAHFRQGNWQLAPEINYKLPKQINVFVVYSQADAHYQQELNKHLKIYRRSGRISTFHMHDIRAGEDVEHNLQTNLQNAQLILFLVSPDFMHSDLIYDISEQAMEQHYEGLSRVIPIWVRETDLGTGDDQPEFAYLRGLPANQQSINKWQDEDEAFTNISKHIGDIALQMQGSLKLDGLQERLKEGSKIWLKFSAHNTNEWYVVEGVRPKILPLAGKELAYNQLKINGKWYNLDGKFITLNERNSFIIRIENEKKRRGRRRRRATQ